MSRSTLLELLRSAFWKTKRTVAEVCAFTQVGCVNRNGQKVIQPAGIAGANHSQQVVCCSVGPASMSERFGHAVIASPKARRWSGRSPKQMAGHFRS